MGSFHGYQCSKNATVERDGKKYCGIHDPVKVKARRAKNAGIAEAKYQLESSKRRIEYLGPALLAMLERILPDWEHCAIEGDDENDPVCQDRIKLRDEAKALIAKAKGEK
jgi:hypothetical protein